MQLYGREKLEAKMRSAIRKSYKEVPHGGRRMPAWGKIRKALIANAQPVMERIQKQAIQAMFGKYGDGPAPSHVVPRASERAQAFADDLIEVSTRRWHEMTKPRTDAEVAAWWKQNFGAQRIKVIGITEVTIAHQTGEDIAWAALKKKKVVLDGYWVTEMNPCSACQAMSGKHNKYWRRFYPAGPPSPHPGCRCHIEHIRKK